MVDHFSLSDSKYAVKRNIYNSNDFAAHYPENNGFKESLKFKILNKFRKCSLKKLIFFIFPFYTILSEFYTVRCFMADLLAGLTMSVLHIPQGNICDILFLGLAYGILAGLKPINGLYTSFFPALVYFFFGTSKHISIGNYYFKQYYIVFDYITKTL